MNKQQFLTDFTGNGEQARKALDEVIREETQGEIRHALRNKNTGDIFITNPGDIKTFADFEAIKVKIIIER